MIILIKSTKTDTVIYFNDKTKENYLGYPNDYINSLCLKKLFDLRGYRISAKQLLKTDRKIPIYIDKRTLLIPLRSQKSEKQVYLNYFAISRYDVYQKSVKIYMCDNIVVVYDKTIDSFKRLLDISQEVIKIKEGI
jgi:hypothetical protein